MQNINESPTPIGQLISQTIAMPRETNSNGDIFGGWLLSQMDLAGAILAGRIASGRVATVAISSMSFLNPVPVGAVVGCYANTLSVGTSSITISIEAWISHNNNRSYITCNSCTSIPTRAHYTIIIGCSSTCTWWRITR